MQVTDILYYSCPYDLSGYASVARNHLSQLLNYKDLNIRLKSKKFWRGVSPDLGDMKDKLKTLERTPIAQKDFIFIEHLTPENFYADPRAKFHIAYTPFETDGAPIPWILPLRGMDEVWVPSQNNKEAYMRVGIDRNKIFVIPHGVDVEKYNPSVEPLKYNRGKFNFGSMFDWTERKNPTALIRAYYNAFCKGEDVTLTIKTFWRFPLEKSKEYIYGAINKIKKGYQDRKTFPKILVWFDVMNEDVMPNFYRSFDCYVMPTRGEGFGLPFLEAMACGVPAIGPKWGGNTEFMNNNNSVLVDGALIPIRHGEFLQLQPQYSDQRWFDVNEEMLSKAIRWIYDNPEEAKKITDVALKEIKDNWTWAHTAQKIYERIMFLQTGDIKNKATLIKGTEFLRGF